MHSVPSFPAEAALASAALALVCAVATLEFHRRRGGRDRAIEDDASRLARVMAGHLSGRVDAPTLRAASSATEAAAFWRALERFADNIGGEEWARVSATLRDVPHVRREKVRVARGPAWRRALAARHLGLVGDETVLGPLRAALHRSPPAVRLAALLALARRRDAPALAWYLARPEVVRGFARHLGVAVLKRFGSSFAPDVRRVLADPDPDEGLVAVAAEVVGLWRDVESIPSLERLLQVGALEARVTAARALGHFRAEGSNRALIAALRDPAWQVRAQAARSLGAIGVTEAIAELDRATRDAAWWVRRNSCYALGDLGAEGYAVLCRVAQLGRDAYAREMAIEVLQALEWDRVSPGGIERVG